MEWGLAEPKPLDCLAQRGEPDAPALIAGHLMLSYSELDLEVGLMAAQLLARGLKPGDRVATWMGKTWLACIMPLAAARAGMVHVPINPVLKRAQAAHILADSGAKLLVANRARLESLQDDDKADAAMVALEGWDKGRNCLLAGEQDPADLVALLYTSGSTGKPKGVMLSHANLWLGAESVATYLGLSPKDRTLAVLPLAFDYGQNQLLSTWYAGGCAIGFDYLLPRDLVKAVGRHDATVLAGVPPLWNQVIAQDWGRTARSLKTLTNSGGHLPEPVVRRLRALFPQAKLHLMYGLTEAFRSTSLHPALVDTNPGAVGTAIPHTEVMVLREDGQEAQAGEEGELVHAGPLVAQGYWKDDEKTAERFRPAPAHSEYGGTAVWSGDRVVKGADGLIRFRGRNDSMIKVSGNRLSPSEVEEAALASGAVKECAAFGVADPALGQAVVLVAVANGVPGEAEGVMMGYFTANCPAYMKPQRVVWRDRLPTGATGKIDRARLLEEIA